MLGCLQLKRYSAQATMKGDDVFKPNTLKLYNARRTYFLQADNSDAMSRLDFSEVFGQYHFIQRHNVYMQIIEKRKVWRAFLYVEKSILFIYAKYFLLSQANEIHSFLCFFDIDF